jgi:hypothetical protein
MKLARLILNRARRQKKERAGLKPGPYKREEKSGSLASLGKARAETALKCHRKRDRLKPAPTQNDFLLRLTFLPNRWR